MTKKITKDEFFRKMEWEGGFEALADYLGNMITFDDIDLHQAWNSFVEALRDLNDIYDDWESQQPDEEENE
jgi:hypothetical protein